jgi:hypothetical protein
MAIFCPDKPVMMSEERRICKSDRQLREKSEGPVPRERKPVNTSLSGTNDAATKRKAIYDHRAGESSIFRLPLHASRSGSPVCFLPSPL